MDEEVGEKAKNTMGTGRNSGDYSIDDILEIEIMSRLPVKSLMRFKCVCKRWQYLIQKDPFLIHLHLSQSLKKRQCLFLLKNPPLGKHTKVLECYWTADLFLDGGGSGGATTTTHSVQMRDPLVFDEFLKPVNGLMCLIKKDMFAVCVYNVSTRQLVIPWIKSTLLDKLKEDYGVEVVKEFREYQFGFEPTTKQHKVICAWRVRTRKTLPGGASVTNYCVVCEVLTLGGNNNKWRKIDEVPPFNILQCKSVHAGGSIYWTGCYDDRKDEVLVSFNVRSEKFGVIRIPYHVTNYRHFEVYGIHSGSCNVHILEVDGCVAFARRTGIHTVELWVFEDEFDKKKRNETTSNLYWRAETVALPVSWTYDEIYFHPVVGTDQLVLQCYYTNPYIPQSVYLYNRKEKTFRGILSSSSASSLPYELFPFYYVITTSVESLLVCG